MTSSAGGLLSLMLHGDLLLHERQGTPELQQELLQRQPNCCCLVSKRRNGVPMGSASRTSPALPLKQPVQIAL